MSKSSKKPEYRFANTPMVKFLSKRIDELKPELTQREIAHRLGVRSVQFVSMMKTGAARVPLEKLPLLAEILGVDPAHLVRLGLGQYWPELDVVSKVLPAPVTKNEMALLRAFRRATDHADPEITPGRQAVVERMFAWVVGSSEILPA
jgi:transcriptional regulator with XRE-family HTH domain